MDNKFYIGYHVNREHHTIYDALMESTKHLRTYGFTNHCAQIFIIGPKSYKKIIDYTDIKQMREYTKQNKLIVHGSYVDFPWNEAHGPMGNIIRELKLCDEIKAAGLVVHLSRQAKQYDILARVLKQIKIKPTTRLYLEINAAKEDHFADVSQLHKLFNDIKNIDPKCDVGLCIDTAHLWSCGVSMASEHTAKTWFESLPNVHMLLHLNDSASELGSGIDRHAPLGYKIWKEDRTGLRYIINWAKKTHTPILLERTKEDLDIDLNILKTLI